MHRMRPPAAAFLAVVLLAACESPKGTTNVVEPASVAVPPELEKSDAIQLVRRTDRLVVEYLELLYQGKIEQASAVKNTVGQTVDADFATFEEVARKGALTLHRNLAVKALGFAHRKRKEAHDLLQEMLKDPVPAIVANAALGLGILRYPETDATRLIELLASGDPEIRINAATAIRDLLPLREIPRELTPEHRAAVDRLVVMLIDRTQVRGRRAAVWALANLRHGDMLPHLTAALHDEDDQVQIGALYGIRKLADPRSIDPLLAYLDGKPPEAQASWAKEALIAIALQSGLGKSRVELEPLGTNSRAWRRYLEEARMR